MELSSPDNQIRIVKMKELPFELVIEILARVPVKDLQRFKSVCKSLKSLIQDERFIIKQATHAPTMILLGSSYLLRTCTYKNRCLEETTFQEPKLNLNFSSGATIIGHSNGLFCLWLRDRCLAVWNPTLRELRTVSRMEPKHKHRSMIGFGYDHSIQDHKIVLIPPNSPTLSKAPQVLTLKSSVSRMIGFPFWRNHCDWFCKKKEGILMGEYIYWYLHIHTTEEKNETIMAFNVVSETFNLCSGPGLRCGRLVHRALKALRGSLCAVEGDKGNLGDDDMVVWSADHDEEDKGRIKSRS